MSFLMKSPKLMSVTLSVEQLIDKDASCSINSSLITEGGGQEAALFTLTRMTLMQYQAEKHH